MPTIKNQVFVVDTLSALVTVRLTLTLPSSISSEGVYVMNADVSGVSPLADSFMTLLAADGGNLLAVSYTEGYVEYGVVVINALGEKTVVFDHYVDHAIVADGRFYWGVGSCAIDGSDVWHQKKSASVFVTVEE